MQLQAAEGPGRPCSNSFSETHPPTATPLSVALQSASPFSGRFSLSLACAARACVCERVARLLRVCTRHAVDDARRACWPVADVRDQLREGRLAIGRLAHHAVRQVGAVERRLEPGPHARERTRPCAKRSSAVCEGREVKLIVGMHSRMCECKVQGEGGGRERRGGWGQRDEPGRRYAQAFVRYTQVASPARVHACSSACAHAQAPTVEPERAPAATRLLCKSPRSSLLDGTPRAELACKAGVQQEYQHCHERSSAPMSKHARERLPAHIFLRGSSLSSFAMSTSHWGVAVAVSAIIGTRMPSFARSVPAQGKQGTTRQLRLSS
eukprot:6184568-Pleurochrysis_carterae.AAC.3